MSSVTSVSGFCYYVLCTHDFSRYSWIKPKKWKSKVFDHFKHFVAKIHNLFYATIMVRQSDNGIEYVNQSFSTFYHEHGIEQRYSCPHTQQLQSNGLAEQKHCHIATLIHSLIHTADWPHTLWVEAAHIAAHLINLTLTPVLG